MRQRKKFLLVALVVAVVATIAGFYYTMHYGEAKKDFGLAVLLGFSSGLYTYLFLSFHFVPVPGRGFASLKNIQEEKEDENAILHPGPAYYEHDFYFNKWAQGFAIFIFFIALAGSVYLLCLGQLLLAILIFLPSSFFLPSHIREFRDKLPQVRIDAQGIWLKEMGYRHWNDIYKIKIEKDKSGKSEVSRLLIYLPGTSADVPYIIFRLDEIKKWKNIPLILSSIVKTTIESDY